MLLSTLDMIHHASSNSLFIFCLCNFIIAILLLRGSKSDSPSNGREGNTCVLEAAPSPDERIEVDLKGKENVNDQGNCEEDDDDYDELRKRVEEFIHKINRTWKAEQMQAGTTSEMAHHDAIIARLAINSY